MVKMNTNGKMIVILTLTVLVFSIHAHPLYEEPHAPAAKVVNPDPLEAAPSEDLPMVHSNDFDTIMPDYDDHHPAESMQYQNFEKFFDQGQPEESEYKMDESQFLKGTPVRAPQPLSPDERRVREQAYETDVQHERQKQQKLKKGATQPRHTGSQWDKFDYDLYSVRPENQKRKN